MKTSFDNEIRLGSWIWSEQPKQPRPQHALFRRDFILEAIPGDCELQIAAFCSFQLYVNGHFFTCGPTPHPVGYTYISRYDISHLMEIGVNSIAVHAFCDYRYTTSHAQHTPGLWMQLIGDNAPIIWTDSKWLCYPLACYAVTDIMVSPAESQVEILDYRQYPLNWLAITQQQFAPEDNPHADKMNWAKVQSAWPLKDTATPLERDTLASCAFEPMQPVSVISRGVRQPGNDVFWVSFADVFRQKGQPGLYAAETYVNCPDDEVHSIFLFSSTPYKFFINKALVSEQNTPSVQHRYSIPQRCEHESRGLDNTQMSAEVQFRKGWNKLLLVKWCDAPQSGFTLIFGDLPCNTLMPRRLADEHGPQGWSVTGPVRTPMQLITPNFTLESLPKIGFSDNSDVFHDAAAFSLAEEYVEDTASKPPYAFPIVLAENQTAVLDFGVTLYAVPRIVISSGNLDDVLDVVTGEHLLGNEVIALENGTRRNTSTLILNECRHPVCWQLSSCKGFRYLMLSARKAKTVITIQSVTAFNSSVDSQARGSFESSDITLNKIWTAGVKTLDATLQGRFLDSPTKDQTQCLPDTMIQALSACFTHGAYNQATDALCAFARTQIETGELNSLSPSSFFQAIPDFSLMWPIWLQKHLMNTADKQLLQKLLPVLNALLDYYNSLAIEDDGPLGHLEEFLGNTPFLDLGELDRNGISTGLNAIYCRALFAAAWIAEFASSPELQEIYKKRATKIAHQIRKLNWNASQHLFADSFSNAQQSPFFSWQSNVLAIYGGIAMQEEVPVIWNQLFKEQPPYENFAQGDFNNPYFKYFILDDAFANGLTQWAFNFIRFYWGKMLDAGATTFWELFDPDNDVLNARICSHCQGYAVSPNAFIISDILGIRAAEPGMTSLFFTPYLEDIQWCRASVPTPQGRVNVSWELKPGNILETTIQANHPVNVIPVLSPKYASKAVFKVSDTVSILAQDVPSANDND